MRATCARAQMDRRSKGAGRTSSARIAESNPRNVAISRQRSTGRNGIIECKSPKRNRLSGDTELCYSWKLCPWKASRARARRARGISSRRYEYFSRPRRGSPAEIFRLLQIARAARRHSDDAREWIAIAWMANVVGIEAKSRANARWIKLWWNN